MSSSAFLLLALLIGVCECLPTNTGDGISSNFNPEEGELFEGDMILDYNPRTRNIMRSSFYRWPKGIIYYDIDVKVFNAREVALINDAIEEFNRVTCVKWVRDPTQDSYALFQRTSSACSSTVGRVSRGKPQRINLGPNCMRKGIIMHEMTHTVGFHHEQSRPDRDDYVTIQLGNVISGKETNFLKYNSKMVTTLNLPYDYGSIMHYGPTYFSYNGSPTIVPKQKGVSIGQRAGFSAMDIKKINTLFGCTDAHAVPTVSSTTTLSTVGGFNCNFEEDLCGLTQIGAAKFERHRGETPTADTGPGIDHTSFRSTGNYLFVDASKYTPGTKGRVETPYISSPTGNYCIIIYNFLYGADNGKLNLGVRYGGQDSTLNTMSRNKDYWSGLRFTLRLSAPIKVYLEGVVGSGPKSDIAIDDFSVTINKC